MEGNIVTCELKAAAYEQILQWLQKNGCALIVEGGFGQIYSNDDWVIKLVKNLDRCRELEIEKTIYQLLQTKLPDAYPRMLVKIPDFVFFMKNAKPARR